MIDINTHQIVDMIGSRDYDAVKEWLSTYKNIEIVSRDGSITYRKAIEDSHPSAIQVSDRFHLLKNLTSYASDYLKKELKQRVSIPIKQSTNQDKPCNKSECINKADSNRKLTLQEKYKHIEQFLAQGKRKTWICKELNMDVRCYDRIINMTPEERESAFNTTMMLKHQVNVNKKMKLVKEVRQLRKVGHSNREISRRTGLAARTIKKYLDENFDPVHASYGKKRSNGILVPFIKKIDACLEEGLMGSVIEKEIRKDGFEGSSSTIRHYITDWKRRRKHDYDKGDETAEKTEVVERKEMLKFLYHKIDKIKSISQEQYEVLCKQYPCFKNIHNIVWEFRELLRTKKVGELKKWMEKVRDLKISELESFTNGLERDIDAVENAIKYEYNNGLAEGSVNKLKVIKRIMYGRCSFDTLRTKTIRLQEMRSIN